MHLVRLDTKCGAIYYTSDSLEKIFNKILKERIDEGYWYLDDQEEKARTALAENKAFDFLLWRQDYEYEHFEVIIPEVVS